MSEFEKSLLEDIAFSDLKLANEKFFEAKRIEKINKELLSKINKSFVWRDANIEEFNLWDTVILRIVNSRPSRVFCIPKISYVIYEGDDYCTKETLKEIIDGYTFETESGIISVGKLTHWAYIPEYDNGRL
jgi:hypothetical protein